MRIADLPTLNAGLNAASLVMLLAGYGAVRRNRRDIHRLCMGAAFLLSAAFLVSYGVYHMQAGSVAFTGRGWVRPVYFSVLISHIVLAALVPPMALRTLWLAMRERFDEHKKWARVTFPVWVYVSATGIAVYWMLYKMAWQLPAAL